MTLTRLRSFKLMLGLVLVALGACASGDKRSSKDLDNLVGKANKTQVVDKLGAPDKQVTTEPGTDIWEYRLDEQKYTSNTGYRFATFKRLRLTFRDGVLATWTQSYETE